MKYSKALLGVAVALAMGGANAADLENTISFNLVDGTGYFGSSFGSGLVNKTFLNSFTFEVGADSILDGSTISQASLKAGKTYDLSITSFDLYKGTTLLTSGIQLLSGPTDVWTLSSGNLSAGSYSFKVGGTILGSGGGSFSGNANVAPVPEPETWSMVATSLAALGFLARRRKSKGNVAA